MLLGVLFCIPNPVQSCMKPYSRQVCGCWHKVSGLLESRLFLKVPKKAGQLDSKCVLYRRGRGWPLTCTHTPHSSAAVRTLDSLRSPMSWSVLSAMVLVSLKIYVSSAEGILDAHGLKLLDNGASGLLSADCLILKLRLRCAMCCSLRRCGSMASSPMCTHTTRSSRQSAMSAIIVRCDGPSCLNQVISRHILKWQLSCRVERWVTCVLNAMYFMVHSPFCLNQLIARHDLV